MDAGPHIPSNTISRRHLLTKLAELLISTRLHISALQEMEQAIVIMFNNVYITSDEIFHELIPLPTSNLPPRHRRSRPPVFFHASISARYRGNPGEVDKEEIVVTESPRSPEGCACTLEAGQLIIINDDHTVAWQLDSFYEISPTYRVYTAIDPITKDTCDIWINKRWSADKDLNEEERTDLFGDVDIASTFTNDAEEDI